MRQKKFLESVILEKKSSPIHGIGIFAKTLIPEGKIFYYIPMNSVHSSVQKGFARLASGLFVNDPLVLNFINHSCDPNAVIVYDSGKPALKSVKKILLGQEITVDYTLTEEKNNLVECKCNSKKCRNFFSTS